MVLDWCSSSGRASAPSSSSMRLMSIMRGKLPRTRAVDEPARMTHFARTCCEYSVAADAAAQLVLVARKGQAIEDELSILRIDHARPQRRRGGYLVDRLR